MKETDTQHRLIELMNTLNITQQDIADRTGIHKSAISMYIHGKRVPRQDMVDLIATAFDLDPAWVMGYDVPMKQDASIRYSSESAYLVAKIRNDSRLTEALKVYFTLPEKEKKHVIDFINMLKE